MTSLLLNLLAKLPCKLRQQLGALLGRFIGIFLVRERRLAKLQLKRFLNYEVSFFELLEIFANFGAYFLEFINIKEILSSKTIKISENDPDLAERIMQSGKPVLALTGHIGNWDLLAAYYINKGARLCTVAKELRNQGWQSELQKIRSGYGIETVWRGDSSGAKTLIRCFKEKWIVAGLLDQDTRVNSEMINFFGKKAKTPASLVDISLRYDPLIVSAFMIRKKNSFEIILKEIKQKTVTSILEEYNQNLEEAIRLAPLQWAWFHKRWRSISVDKTMSRQEYIDALRYDQI